MSHTRAFVAAICALGILAIGSAPGAWSGGAVAQVGAGMLSSWADGETWTRYLVASAETEVGLGLHPSGTGGSAMLSFSARWPGRTVKGTPKEILVFAAPPANFTPNLRRAPTLIFVVDLKTLRRTVFDWSSRLSVFDQTGPGGQPTTGIAKISPEEYARLARATSIGATIFGIDVELKTVQRLALRNLALKFALK